jgi:hypothetical protein
MAPPGVTTIRREIDPNRLPDTSSSNSRFDICTSHKSGSGRILQQLLYDCADDLVALLWRHAVSDFQLKPDRPGKHIGRSPGRRHRLARLRGFEVFEGVGPLFINGLGEKVFTTRESGIDAAMALNDAQIAVCPANLPPRGS